MRTYNEVFNYINQNQYYDSENDFSVAVSKIIETIDAGEEIIFASGSRAVSSATHVMCKNGAVVAITNRRLIYAGKSAAMFSKNVFVKTVSLEYVSDITCNEKAGGIAIDCRNELVVFWTNKSKITEVYNKVNSTIYNIKNASSSTSVSVADELKKFKELLDIGVITQEEFDTKKKQLLGIGGGASSNPLTSSIQTTASAPVNPPAPQMYSCPNCRDMIAYGTSKCKNCGTQFNWG